LLLENLVLFFFSFLVSPGSQRYYSFPFFVVEVRQQERKETEAGLYLTKKLEKERLTAVCFFSFQRLTGS